MKATLTKKLGPLPTWGWLLIGTAVLAYFIYRHKQAAGQSVTPASGANTTGGIPMSQLSGYSGLPFGSYQPPPTPTTTPPVPLTQAQTDQALLSKYQQMGTPISLDQAYLAIFDAFQTALGRPAQESPTVDAWAQQIVSQQNYLPVLSGIVYSGEGIAKINTPTPVAPSPVLAPSSSTPGAIQPLAVGVGITGGAPSTPVTPASRVGTGSLLGPVGSY